MADSRTSSLGIGVALAAAVVGVGVFAGIRFLFFGLTEPTPWDKPARAVDATVELTYQGRECRDRVDVRVEEDASTVVITVEEVVRSVVCGDGEERSSYDVSVELDAPLGERELVDGACRLGQFERDERCAPDLAPAS